MAYPNQKICMTTRSAAIVVLVALSIFLSGCSAPRKIDPGFVADRWSTTLREFNIDPIFLPRQVHLGDIYLAGEPEGVAERDANRWKRRTLYLGRAAVIDAIKKDTQTRLRLPSTSAGNSTDDIFQAPAITTALRPVAFPGFNVSEIRESDLSAAFPFNLFRAIFGASGGGELVMSMSIPSAEYEEIPALEAWKKFGEFCWEEGKAPVCAASNPVLRQLFDNLKLPSEKSRLVPRVGIVTSVYYARRIDYFYNTNKRSAFGATASLPMTSAAQGAGVTAQAGAAAAPAAGASAPVTAAASTAPATAAAPATPAAASAGATAAAPTPGSAAAETAALQASVQALQSRLDDLQKKGDGTDKYGLIRIVSSTSEGTTLSQTFDRPVAIGYRALWIFPMGYSRGAEGPPLKLER